MENELIIRTSIANDFLKKYLLQGFCLSIIGIFLLIGASIFLPEPILNNWGWLLYIFALALITLGLLPYRKLSKLQNKPNEIRVTNQVFQFWSKGVCRFSTSLKNIHSFSYNNKDSAPKIVVNFLENYELPQNLQAFQVIKEGKADSLTFLYFSQRSFNELMEWLHELSEPAD